MRTSVIGILLLSTVCFAESKEIKISAMLWSPYVDRHMPDKGIIPHIVNEVFSETDYIVKYEYSDWVDVSVKANNRDQGFSAYLPERYPRLMLKKFNCSTSILDVPMILVGKVGSIISIDAKKQSNITIGSVSEYPLDTIEVFLRKSFSNATFYDIPNEISLLNKVLIGDLNFAYIDSLMYYHVIRNDRLLKKYSADLVVVSKVGELPTYICFNSESKDILNKFNNALVDMNTLDVLYKYLPDFANIIKQESK